MKHNPLGQSGLSVSEIGLGCMSLGTDPKTAHAIIGEALNLGITFFDTADLYDKGENERLVGQALKGERRQVILASKVGNRWNADGTSWRWDPSPEWISTAIQQSLERLQTDYLDLYQLHGGTLDDPMDEIVDAFEQLKRQGLIRAYGISSIRPNVIRKWLERSQLSSVMMQCSLLDRRPEEDALPRLAEAGVSVIARGPVAKGLLATKPASEYLNHSAADVTRIQQTVAALVTPERSAAHIALRFALSNPAVATVIPGASSILQLRENVATSQATLSHDELETLKTAVPVHTYSDHR
jgi:aryl-alcohol dehydrogenase-like predicted oxidoreductase